MMNRKKLLCGLCGVLCILVILIGREIYSPKSDINVENIQREKKLIQCKYYNAINFHISVNDSDGISLDDKEIVGGIVPHHLLADKMIASFFKTVAKKQPDVVVVVAPNHTGAGVSDIHTGSWTWDTPFGELKADKTIVDYFIDSGIADANFTLMENEHSISSVVPYIKYFMPDTKIVPILVSGTCGINKAIELGEKLSEQLREKSFLVIASVDFSHYLSVEEADKKDEFTKKVLLSRDILTISHMNNDYMDSPSSIITLITVMNNIGAKNAIILEHNNSARISGENRDYTTSYFTVVYWK